jgi:hypothetical protein
VSVEEGIQASLRRHGSNATIVVIPKGPYLIPAVRNEELRPQP